MAKVAQRAAAAVAAAMLLALSGPAAAAELSWQRLREGGLVLLVRHAATQPGLGDPPNFRVEDCATQRNLSEEGRAQSRRMGERFRAEKVPIASVLTSPWCRCRDTATLAFGKADDWEALSSFFDMPHREAEYAERVRQRIGTYAFRKPKGNVVMVTHNVNIAAISKLSVAPGEIVAIAPDGCCKVKVVGRLRVE